MPFVVAKLFVKVVMLEALFEIFVLAVVISLSLDVMLVVFVFTVLVKLVVLVAFCVILVSAVFKSFVNVVILLALVFMLLVFVLMLLALAAIRESSVAVHTFGVPATSTYNLLLSLVSYHKEPVAPVTAGGSFCLNTSGFNVMFVVLVETVLVKDV